MGKMDYKVVADIVRILWNNGCFGKGTLGEDIFKRHFRRQGNVDKVLNILYSKEILGRVKKKGRWKYYILNKEKAMQIRDGNFKNL